MIRWKSLDPAKTERAIKMLIRDIHPDVQGIDGAGGDGGRDIYWDSPDGRVVFEVKSYTERLGQSPRRKIKASLTKAASYDPVRWVLILPLEPSPAELVWFEVLRGLHPTTTLEWRGIDWLDGQFASRPHFQRYIEGADSDLLRRAAEHRQEEDVLARGVDDILTRLGRLDRDMQELSLLWRFDVSTQAGEQIVTLSERASGAAELDPIAITPIFAFPADDPEAEALQTQVTRTLDYGGKVNIDGRYVERVDVDASPELTQLLGVQGPISQIEFVSIEQNQGLPVLCTLETSGPGGETLASIVIPLAHRVGGGRGVTIWGTDVSGVLRVNHFFDYPTDGLRHGSLGFELHPIVGHSPHAMRQAAEFLLSLKPGNRVQLSIGHAVVGRADIGVDELPDFSPVSRLIIALDDLQRHFRMQFPMPDGLTLDDLRQMEMLCDLVANTRTRWLYHSVKANIRADRLDSFMAEEKLREPGAMLARFESIAFEFGGHRFPLGQVQLYAPRMELTNLDELDAALGTGREAEARWKCIDGEHIYIRHLTGDVPEWPAYVGDQDAPASRPSRSSSAPYDGGLR